MAETTLRTFWCILALLFILPTVITSVLSIKTKEEKENSVTFVGFVNDHQNKFSALLEVEILASRLPPPRANDANHGKNKDNNNFGLWLASEDPESCIGKAVYGRAKVEPVHDGGLFGAKNADYQTMQLLLPLAASAPISEHQERTLYLCLRFGSEWQSLGPSSKFTLPKVTMTQVLNEEDDDDEEFILEDNKIIKQPAVRSRKSRALNESIPEEIEAKAMDTANVPRITNIRLRGITKDVKYADEGHIVVLEGHVVPLFIYGYGLTNETQVVFTSAQDEFGDFCDSPTDTHVKSSHIRITMLTENMAQIDIPGGDLPSVANQEQFYLCLKSEDSSHFVHQGTDTSLKIEVETLPLPIWVMIIFLCILLCLSGLFSGLNLGLMALDQTELKIVQNTGSDKEKDYANKIFPIRKHGNFLLCSLLLGNVLVNNTLTILLDTLTSGLVAVIGATMGIVIFGEIIPQAICSRHGLAVGAYTIFLTKLFMVLTFPLSYPISKILDCLLGAEIGIKRNTVLAKPWMTLVIELPSDNDGNVDNEMRKRRRNKTWIKQKIVVPSPSHFDFQMSRRRRATMIPNRHLKSTVYDKKKLIELLQVTHGANDLEKDEVDIVTGALVYKEKTVRSVMTRLEDCYMLPIKTVLNFETVAEIREQGYSRIPVYDGDRTNIVHILYARDLMFIDPDDNMPLQMICEFYSNETNNVFADTPLNEMFNEFKTGEKGHMAFIQEVNDTGEGDPFYETIGLITLEDIIEEIIQQEIVDETDVVIDNRTKKKRRRENFKGGTEGTTFHQMFSEASKKIAISPQLTMAVFQYLTTSIVPFKSEYISEVVLKRLLTMDIYNEIKMKKETAGTNKRTHHHSQEDLIIIEKGKPIDYFVLIIEGKVEVNIGREELIFESGPFTYFGIQTLNQVIESPSSPLIAFKNNHTNANNTTAGTPSSVNSADMKHLRKASTQQSIEVNPPATSNALMTKRHSAQAEMGLPSRTGSIFQAYPGFIPDYTIKALSDVLYLKIKRTTYLRAMKATLMGKKASHSGELNERELEHLLEKVNEDENMEQDINMMLRTPLGHSPNRSEGTTMDQEVTRVKIGTSGTSTPIMTVRGEPARLSMTSNRSEAMKDEFWPSEKESSNNMSTTVAFKAPIATHDSETTVSMSGASNNSNSNNTKITVEANGEAIKGKNDDSTNGLNSSGVGGNNNITSETTGGGQTSTQQLDAISPQSDSGIRTSLLNKEFGR